MELKRSERQLWICGDIHGELSALVRNAINRGISCADILVVGDFGAGFGRPNSMNVAYGKVHATLEKNDICIHTIRGNHDDPLFFDGLHNFERLHFLQDHRILPKVSPKRSTSLFRTKLRFLLNRLLCGLFDVCNMRR